MNRVALLLALAGCRSIFGIGSTALEDGATSGDDDGFVYKDAHVDGPPDSPTGGCVVHGDCTSGACLPDGTCAAPTDIAWVLGSAPDTGTCTQASPCRTITAALATAKPYIRVLQSTVSDSVMTSATVTILADAGAILTAPALTVTLTVQGSGNVGIYDLEILSAQGSSGIQIQGASRLELQRCQVHGSTGLGIDVTGTLIANRTRIYSNGAGGVLFHSGTLKITNSVLSHNGTNQNDVGGIRMQQAPAPGSLIELDTIADNRTRKAASTSGGVMCANAFPIGHSLFAGNVTGGSVSDGTSNYNNCVVTSSFIAIDISSVHFASLTQPFDYHLTAQTPTTIIDQPFTSTVTDDLDGQVRPIGNGFDYGADEYKP